MEKAWYDDDRAFERGEKKSRIQCIFISLASWDWIFDFMSNCTDKMTF